MKLVFIIGPGAVGKMTVGQELTKITNLKLMHNHQMIEPVLDIFGYFDIDCIIDLRYVIFEHFAKSFHDGLIFTMMYNFDSSFTDEHMQKTIDIFKEFNEDLEVYYIELKASLEERLKRNTTENRLNNKPSKRDIEISNRRLISENEGGRFNSYEGEKIWENHIVIDNTNLPPEEVALIIKEKFNF